MKNKSLEDFLSSSQATLNHPLFYTRIFALISRECRLERRHDSHSQFNFIFEEYEELSRRLDRSKIQESCAVRNILRTRNLANCLIQDNGDMNNSLLPEIIEQFKNNLYSYGPGRQYDAKRQEHILNVLNHLNTNKAVNILIKKINRPYANKLAESFIRQTLQLPINTNITDAHTRRAVLAAWLCLLRQNVGSCFATAPAEIVQTEQPELFLQDLNDLIVFCRLNRVFEGVEYSVPLSDTWGNGDLKKPLLIKHTSRGITPEIWCSPGLIAAFEAIGLLNQKDKIKIKIDRLQEWLEPLLKQKCNYAYCVITAEEIIRTLLLQNLGLNNQQLKDYESRPPEIKQSSFLIVPVVENQRVLTLEEKYDNFFRLFNQAKDAFKALTDNPLLKAWEFTLASFSETKLEFTGWNLYASLGMATNISGGIGAQIQTKIQSKLDEINRSVQDVQYEYETAFIQVKTLESRIKHTSTETEMKWIKMEYQNRLHEFRFLEEQRDVLQLKAQKLVNLYDIIYQSYINLFKEYFQEVYDADMQEVQSNPFDDSPAGFRLLYKHGRNNPSQWTRLKNLNDYVEALTSFFVATEPQIASIVGKELEREFSEVVSVIISFIRTKEFQESTFQRMAAAHRVPLVQDPLNNLEKIEKKPWSYTSGGTMNNLITCYYDVGHQPAQQEKWIENEMELLVFIVDTLKLMPPRYIDPYLKKQRTALLMQSPTHAFLLKPNTYPFLEAWQNDEFTYTSVRDRFVQPAEIFVRQLLLNDQSIEYFFEILAERIPENYLPYFKSVFRDIKGPLTPLTLREIIADSLQQDRGLHFHKKPVLSLEEVDSTLFKHLPFFPAYELEKRIGQLVSLLPNDNRSSLKEILSFVQTIPLERFKPFVSAYELQQICKALLCLCEMRTSSSYDYHLLVSQAARKLGYALPHPIIFADTNWLKDEFGFVVNPGTARLELWRLDYTASVGYPMRSWQEWLDGSHPQAKWSIYVKPTEYGQY